MLELHTEVCPRNKGPRHSKEAQAWRQEAQGARGSLSISAGPGHFVKGLGHRLRCLDSVPRMKGNHWGTTYPDRHRRTYDIAHHSWLCCSRAQSQSSPTSLMLHEGLSLFCSPCSHYLVKRMGRRRCWTHGERTNEPTHQQTLAGGRKGRGRDQPVIGSP